MTKGSFGGDENVLKFISRYLVLSKMTTETFGLHYNVLEVWSCQKYPHLENAPGFK